MQKAWTYIGASVALVVIAFSAITIVAKDEILALQKRVDRHEMQLDALQAIVDRMPAQDYSKERSDLRHLSESVQDAQTQLAALTAPSNQIAAQRKGE